MYVHFEEYISSDKVYHEITVVRDIVAVDSRRIPCNALWVIPFRVSVN